MEIADITVGIIIFLFCAAFVAGFLDTLAGGGGLIALPALLVCGLPPLLALGTNKLQGSMGTATATFVMLRTRRVAWNSVKYLMLTAFIGSFLGTVAVQFIDPKVLNFIIPVVLVIIIAYFLLVPPLQNTNAQPKISLSAYRRFVVPVIGWYDGMFGPGTGSFFVLSGVALRSHGLIDSTAIAKTLNFSTNIASLLIFIVAGKVVWIIGIIMMLGQFLGAWSGSHCLFKIHPRYLRVIVVVMCMGMLGKFGHSMGWFI